jgi:hypothetical protein
VNDVTPIATSAPHSPNGIFERIERSENIRRVTPDPNGLSWLGEPSILPVKPHFRFAPDCFGQMRPKRCHHRLGAMRVAPAVGPLAIEIVRMLGDTAHLSLSRH